MKKSFIFFKEKITRIFTGKKTIIDIGGGLRISKTKGDSYSSSGSWILPYLNKVEYKILDPVPNYNPDIIGDIHNLPFGNNSQDAIICISVLEHVENPILACKELYRVLKPGGYCYVGVPFLHCYHPKNGYYKDYWRFTKDTIKLLFKNFSTIEIQETRGALETWLMITPLGRIKLLLKFAEFLDLVFKKNKSNQVSGFNVFLVK
jgi:SAM-dependent methyltransferase